MTYQDPRPTSPIAFQITHPEGGGSRRITIKVTDEASGVILIEGDMTPEQFADLLSLRMTHVDAHVPGETAKALLFRHRETETRKIPTEVGTKHAYHDDAEVTARVDAWAEQQAEGWDTWQVATNSQQFYVTLRRWAPRTTETAQEGAHA